MFETEQRRWKFRIESLHGKLKYVRDLTPEEGNTNLRWLSDANFYLIEAEKNIPEIRYAFEQYVFIPDHDDVRNMTQILLWQTELRSIFLEQFQYLIKADSQAAYCISNLTRSSKRVRQAMEVGLKADDQITSSILWNLRRHADDLARREKANQTNNNSLKQVNRRQKTKRSFESTKSVGKTYSRLELHRELRDTLEARVHAEDFRQAFSGRDAQPRSQFRRFRN